MPAKPVKAKAASRPSKGAGPARKRTPARSKATKPASAGPQSIDAWLQGLPDWRGRTLAHARALVMEAAPDAVEQIKWRKPSNAMRGVPTWSRGGLITTGEPYKDKVKLTFAKGASLPDPAGLFNAAHGGHTRRAIDLREGDALDAQAFKALVRAAVEANRGDA